MKLITYILFFFLVKLSNAQTIAYWIYDTAAVTCFYANKATIPDTIAYLKKEIDTVKTGNVIIYWDKEGKHTYTELINNSNNRITYYRNGQINEEIFYKDAAGKKYATPLWKAWYPDGNKKGEITYKGSEQSTVSYYHNGRICLKDVSILGGFVNEPATYAYVYSEQFCENGQLIRKDSVNSLRIRTILVYHCNGKLAFQFRSNGANIFGKWQKWYENGQLEIEGQYDESTMVTNLLHLDASNQQGDWKYYNPQGKLIKIEKYKDNNILETISY